jgi:hypothetical protein
MEDLWKQGGGKGEVPLNYSTNMSDDPLKQIYDFHLKEIKKSSVRKDDFFHNTYQRQVDIIGLKVTFLLKLQVARSFRNVNVNSQLIKILFLN